MKILHTIAQGANAILFPSACLCCGDIQSGNAYLVCPYCIEHHFDAANPMHHDSCTEIFLPEHINFQDALWKYDKGGYIQELLVQLKYHGMGKLGGQLGTLLGFHLLSNPAFRQKENYLLIPVPLHASRKRKRGYNQALLIAEGISSVTNIPVLEEISISRIRNTQSQTGFNLNKRMQNIKDAFKVNKPEALSGRVPIIVDDVFTTGTTTFELAAAVKPFSKQDMGIVTVALA